MLVELKFTFSPDEMFWLNEIISMFVVCMHKLNVSTQGFNVAVTLVKQNSLIKLVTQVWGKKLKYKYEKKIKFKSNCVNPIQHHRATGL